MKQPGRRWWSKAAVAVVVIVLATLMWRRESAQQPLQTGSSQNSPAQQESSSEVQPSASARTSAALEQATSAAPAANAPREPYASEADFDWNSTVEWSDERGVLLGRVLRGIAPLEGARISLWRRDEDAWPPLVEVQPLRTTTSDRDGRFRFDKLIAGEYRLRADHDGQFVEQPTVRLDEQAQNRVAYLLFGSSVIDGHVFDDSGLARARECVRIVGIGPAQTRAQWTYTDASGFFECRGLLAGKYHVMIAQGETWDGNRERMIDLGVADRASVRFGLQRNGARWTGRLVDAHADVVSGQRPLRVQNKVTKDVLRFRSAADGSFAFDLGEGEWTVSTESNTGKNCELGSAQLFGSDIERDLVLPGVRLVIEIVAPREEALNAQFQERAMGSLDLNSSAGSSPGRPERAGDWMVQWCFLEPHDYVLESMNSPRIADSEFLGPEAVPASPENPFRALRIELRADQPVHRMQLRMTSAPWGRR